MTHHPRGSAEHDPATPNSDRRNGDRATTALPGGPRTAVLGPAPRPPTGAGGTTALHDVEALCGRQHDPRQRVTCLRLVHGETLRGPGRPGWAVHCVETGTRPERLLRVSVVIPTKNEARNLPLVIPQIPREATEVVIVDGCSSDDTTEVVRELRPDAVLLRQEPRGKGHALRTGFETATGDIIVSMDGDGSMSPREIPALVDALVRGADLAKGSRSLGDSADLTRVRGAGNRGLSWMFNLIHGTRHTDITYGYLAFWRWHLPHLLPDCTGFEVEALLNVKAALARLDIAEVPSYEARRAYGDSNLRTVRDGVRFLRAYGGGNWGGVLRGVARARRSLVPAGTPGS